MSALVKALVAITAIAAVAELAAGKNYTIQWEATGNYSDWSAKNPVRVGDTVGELPNPSRLSPCKCCRLAISGSTSHLKLFTYGPTHTVDELSSEADFAACNFTSPISSEDTGSTAVTFGAAGTRYFACETGSHCRRGQKVAITVADDSAAAPPTGGAQSPAPVAPPPKGNSAARVMADGAGLVAKLALGLSIGGVNIVADDLDFSQDKDGYKPVEVSNKLWPPESLVTSDTLYSKEASQLELT
ncbi:hypothetical protein EJB05_39698, partial [Eragrostis curvula]